MIKTKTNKMMNNNKKTELSKERKEKIELLKEELRKELEISKRIKKIRKALLIGDKFYAEREISKLEEESKERKILNLVIEENPKKRN